MDGTVTLVFTDIERSTDLAERLGDAAWARLLRDHDAAVRESAATHGGHVVKALGDGFMLAFGSARAALSWAAATQEALAGGPVRVRMGVHAGDAVREGDDWVGHHVTVAARIAASAAGGEVLVSDVARHLAAGDGSLRFGVEQSTTLKGISGQVRLAPLRWQQADVGEPLPDRRAGSELVGRAEELAAVSRAVAAGGLVLVHGEAGIGKTRLAREVASRAEARGVRVVWGRCWEGAGAPPYWPWIQVLRSLGGDGAPDLTAAAGGGGEVESARFQLFDSVTQHLVAVHRARPVLIVLDDVHWADAGSLVLVRMVSGTGVPVVATVRSDASGPAELAPLGRLATTVTLDGLDVVEVGQLLGGVDDAVSARVRDMTNGNPFFVDELSPWVRSGGGLPAGLRSAIRSRVDALDPSTVDVLLAGAVAGREFDARLVAMVVGAGPDDVLERLDRAAAAGVVRPTEGRAGGFSFVHALVREALYEDLPRVRRRELHTAVAGALRDRYRMDEGPHLAELAHHLAAAGLTDDAIAYARRAGDRALAQLAWEDAAAHYADAVRLLDEAGPADLDLRAELLVQQCIAESTAGPLPTAGVAAVAAAKEAARADLVAQAALGVNLWPEGEPSDPGMAALSEAYAVSDRLEPALRARVLARLYSAKVWAGAVEPALKNEALAIAEEVGDPALTIYVLRCTGYVGVGTPEEIRAVIDRLEALATERADEEGSFWVALHRSALHLLTGNVAGADAEVTVMARVAAAEGLAAEQVLVGLTRAGLLRLRGRVDDAYDVLARTRDRADKLGKFVQRVSGVGRLFHVVELGPSDRVRASARAFAAVEPLAWSVDLYFSAVDGDVDASRAALRRPHPRLLARPVDLGRNAVRLMVEAAALIGDPEPVAWCDAWLRPHRGQTITAAWFGIMGTVDHTLGVLARLRGDLDEAEELLVAAATQNAAMGARFLAVGTDFELARVALARGDRRRAEELAAHALAEAEAMGMAPVATRLRDFVASVAPAPAVPLPDRRAGSPMVGRDDELATVEAAPGLVLIHGEAGIGKTRLAREVASRAEARGVRVVWGRCWEGEGAPPYWPWIQVLRAFGDDGPDLQAGGSTEHERFALFDDVARFLAGRAPLLVVVDDLQWADPASLVLLQMVSSAGVRVIATVRDGEALPPELPPLSRLAQSVHLAGLDATQVNELLGGVGASVAEHVRDLTNGNPFFVDEVAPYVTAGEPLPPGVRAAVRLRVDRLAREVAAALVAASVLGREFDARTVAAMGHDADLDEAESAGIVRAVDEHGHRYAFAHALVREALYEDLLRGRRRTMHAAAARALQERHRADEDAHLAELAHHHAAAGMDDDAASYARRAGDRAYTLMAWEDAVAHYARAAQLFERMTPPDHTSRAEVLTLQCEAEARLYGRATAATGRIALDAALSSSRSELVMRGALATTGWEWYPAPEIRTLLHEAYDRSTGLDPGLRACVAARLYAGLVWVDDVRPGLIAEARAAAAESGDARVRAFVLQAAAQASVLPPREVLSLLDELLATAREAGDHDRTFWAHLHRCAPFLLLADVDGAARALDDAARAAIDLRVPYAAFLGVVRAGLLRTRGDLRGALAELDRTLAASESRGDRLIDLAVMVDLERSLVLRDTRGASGGRPAMRTMSIFDENASFWAWSGLSMAEAGRHADARRLLRERHPYLLARPLDLGRLNVALVVDAAVLMGDADAVDGFEEWLLPHRGEPVTAAWYGVMGTVDHTLGQLAALRGDLDLAVERFEAARDLNARMGARTLAVRTDHELAVVLLQQGDTARAHDLLAGALAEAEDMGMAPMAERIRTTMAGVEPLAPATGPAPEPVEGTFASEGDVWLVRLGAEQARVKHSKGMDLLAKLLERPGQEMHVLDLVGASGAGLGAGGGTGVALDATAKQRYRERLADLAEELDEATAFNDTARAEKAQAEVDALTDQLTRAVGLGGRDRTGAAAASERARVSVTRAIRSAVDRIAKVAPVTGRHLGATVRTGTFCAYEPDPAHPVRWRTR